MLYPRSAICVLVGAAFAASGAYAQSQTSQPQTSIGVLTCTSGAGIEGKGAADNPDLMTCGFKPTSGGAEQRYSGTFKTAAQDAQSAGGQARVGVVGRWAPARRRCRAMRWRRNMLSTHAVRTVA